MKKSFAAFTALVLLCLVACGPSSGCAGRGQLNPTTGVYSPDLPASSLVVAVEAVRENALGVFDSVMKIEAANREALTKTNPGFHAFAEGIRRNGQTALNSLTSAKVAFQKSRSEADASALRNALATVQSLLTDSLTYLADSAVVKKASP